jgi:hypothetical protein
MSKLALGPNLAYSMDIGVLSWQWGGVGWEVKWLRHEVDHSPPSSDEVKSEWSYTSTLPICLHVMDRDNFTTTLYV